MVSVRAWNQKEKNPTNSLLFLFYSECTDYMVGYFFLNTFVNDFYLL